MELRHLRHFVAVGEELHFGRAAKRLGMAQPPLSQSIMRLENDLGVKLLQRSSSKVTLTKAGRVFLEESRQIVAHADLAARLAQQAASGDLSRLRIGCMPWALMRVLPRAIGTFRKQWPGVEVRLYERATKMQVEGLWDGSFDVGVISRNAADLTGLAYKVVECSTTVAAVPSSWDIASKKSVRVAELAPYPFVMFPKSWNPEFLERFMAICRKAGFVPKITQEAAQPYTMLGMVASELGITLLRSTASQLEVKGVSLIAVRDLPSTFNEEIAITWVPQNESPTLRRFVDIIEAVGNPAAAQ